MRPEDFLKEKYGILMTAVSFICYLDGAMRQPDLAQIMEEFANARIIEEKERENRQEPPIISDL